MRPGRIRHDYIHPTPDRAADPNADGPLLRAFIFIGTAASFPLAVAVWVGFTVVDRVRARKRERRARVVR